MAVAAEGVPQAGEDARRTLVYEESQRALDQQQAALDNLRTRAGVLIAATALASSFLGAQALRSGTLTLWSGLAIAALIAVGAMTILVLVPQGGWAFSNKVGTLLSGYVERTDRRVTIDDMHTQIAKWNQKHRDENAQKLEKLYWFFRVACGALVIEVVFWLIDLGTRAPG